MRVFPVNPFTHWEPRTMTVQTERASAVPRTVSLFSPILQFLLKRGVPLGVNGLITIRGRTSGEPRTAAVAIIKVGDRRWIWSPWGDVHWVRNLRAAGQARLTVRRRQETVTATELDGAERVAFFRDVLGPFAGSIRGGVTFVRLLDGVDLRDPVAAADGRRVFELHPAGPDIDES
jgi:deazaflavin-dependent oxidoreductase (nitroreductase family)